LGFEIEAGRQPHVGVGGAGEAVDAAVLAAAIGIDRAVERDVGRVVAGDDLARGVNRDRGLERRQVLEILPAVVETFARLRLVAAAGGRPGAPPPPPLAGDARAGGLARPAPGGGPPRGRLRARRPARRW